jgi:transcriptional regulator of NAD metabolism
LSKSRRKKIQKLLEKTSKPIKGTELAKKFEVSRQVIVQDVAVLRASGLNIIATSNGYQIPRLKENKIIKTFISNHHGTEAIKEELDIIVDGGGKVIDITISHPVYGDIVCSIMVETRKEVSNFLRKLSMSKAVPLSVLTDGEHYHTIEVSTEEEYEIIMEGLREKGYVK